MTKIELLKILTTFAKDYRDDAKDSIVRNRHMNDCAADQVIEQYVIDAILTDYINYVAYRQGVDYGLYSSDLTQKD